MKHRKLDVDGFDAGPFLPSRQPRGRLHGVVDFPRHAIQVRVHGDRPNRDVYFQYKNAYYTPTDANLLRYSSNGVVTKNFINYRITIVGLPSDYTVQLSIDRPTVYGQFGVIQNGQFYPVNYKTQFAVSFSGAYNNVTSVSRRPFVPKIIVVQYLSFTVEYNYGTSVANDIAYFKFNNTYYTPINTRLLRYSPNYNVTSDYVVSRITLYGSPTNGGYLSYKLLVESQC